MNGFDIGDSIDSVAAGAADVDADGDGDAVVDFDVFHCLCNHSEGIPAVVY